MPEVQISDASPQVDLILGELVGQFSVGKTSQVEMVDGMRLDIIEALSESLPQLLAAHVLDGSFASSKMAGVDEEDHVDLVPVPALKSFQDGKQVRMDAPVAIIKGQGNRPLMDMLRWNGGPGLRNEIVVELIGGECPIATLRHVFQEGFQARPRVVEDGITPLEWAVVRRTEINDSMKPKNRNPGHGVTASEADDRQKQQHDRHPAAPMSPSDNSLGLISG
jgi:hypothetical protein